MSKKKSIVVLILSLVMTVLLGCVVTLGIDKGHAGSMKNIKTGLDLSGGVSITYEAVSDNPSDEEMSDTMNKLRQRVEQYSTEAMVSRQGEKSKSFFLRPIPRLDRGREAWYTENVEFKTSEDVYSVVVYRYTAI